jgi:hypothetical protein
MNDPNSPDRVPLDRPPVPRFNPLPDLPDLPEMPRGSSIPPTPSVPIPAPPVSLPAPRVMVDLPKPTVSVEPPRPAPRTTTPPQQPAEAPKPVAASTPAPKGRWVGEALASLVRPTKSKATVLAAAGSLVAGAFGLQVLVSQLDRGDALATSRGPVAAKKVEDNKPSPEKPDEESKQAAPTIPPIPDPLPGASSAPVAVAPRVDDTNWPTLPGLTGVTPRTTDVSTLPKTPPPLKSFPPPENLFRDSIVIPASAEAPAPLAIPGGVSAPAVAVPMLPATPGSVPVAPAPAIPDPVTVPMTPLPVVPLSESPSGLPKLVKVTLPTLPGDPTKLDTVTPPKPVVPAAVKPADVTPISVSELLKPAPVEMANPTVLPKPAFTEVLPTTPAPSLAAPVLPAPPAMALTPVPVQPFVPVETPREPLRPVPLPRPMGEVRTDYDVDLHPAQAGQTYESISKQHYGDAKYADALRASNKGRDPGREEIQLPPTHVLRKLTSGTRTPSAVNPIAPVGDKTWTPSPTTGPRAATVGRSYTVPQDGVTFRDLAGTLLNDRTKYKRISDLNPTIDANAKLTKGDKIAVP